MLTTIFAVIGAITSSKALEVTCIIMGGITAMVFIFIYGEKTLYAQLKNEVFKYSIGLDIPFEWRIKTFYKYIEVKLLHHAFKDEWRIIECLAEFDLNPKTKYEIKEIIRKNVPDTFILNSKDEILTIVRFTNLNNLNNRTETEYLDDTPFLYDTNGVFLGIIREYKYIVDAKGIYRGELIIVLGYFYAVPYEEGFTARFKPLPNIIFTPNEIENFKKHLPNEMILQRLPDYKPKILLDII